jgi:hypothetical protein
MGEKSNIKVGSEIFNIPRVNLSSLFEMLSNWDSIKLNLSFNASLYLNSQGKGDMLSRTVTYIPNIWVWIY